MLDYKLNLFEDSTVLIKFENKHNFGCDLFNGEIKNKSELKQILKMIGYESK